jgi:hypothetical protein
MGHQSDASGRLHGLTGEIRGSKQVKQFKCFKVYSARLQTIKTRFYVSD